MLVVGFDLDMTLVDSREAVTGSFSHTLATFGVAVPPAELHHVVGPPLWETLPAYLTPEQVEAALEVYREHHRGNLGQLRLLPGAREALDAVHDLGGRVLIVSGKQAPMVRLALEAVGLDIDTVAGGVFGADKGVALREAGAQMYVGDHVMDMAGAQAAGALGVGVATGVSTREELAAAGADVILTDLTAFPAWLSEAARPYQPEGGPDHPPRPEPGESSLPR